MNLKKWNPTWELEDISKRLNRLFGRAHAHTESNQEMLATIDWTPSVDISETETAYLIKGEIPGVKKEDLKVTLQDGKLTIAGERKMEKEEKDKEYYWVERSYGNFMRSFCVPNDTDGLAVKAEFKDGILNITLPKSAMAKSKAIEISVS